MQLSYDTPERVNMDPEKLNQVMALTEKAIADKITSALNICVARHGKIVYHRAIGNLTLAPGSPPAPLDALYSIRSVSKPITAVCIMILHERGLLSVNDRVDQYIPEFTGKGKSKVKIHHLFTHTSGIFDDDIHKYCHDTRDTFVMPETKPKYIPRDAGWWLRAFTAPLTKQTGKEMSYSNIGYNMLGFIVKIVTDKNINTFARENLFKPLGMNDTSYVKSARQIEGRVIERIPPEGQKINWMCSTGCFNRMSGCCSVSSTAYDLTIFGQMLLNGGEYNGVRILSQESVDLMTTNQIPGVPAVYGAETFTEAAWSYGFNTVGVQSNYPTNATYGHGGHAGACLCIDPILDMVIVTLKALHFHHDEDYCGVGEVFVAACNDYDELKTQPL